MNMFFYQNYRNKRVKAEIVDYEKSQINQIRDVYRR